LDSANNSLIHTESSGPVSGQEGRSGTSGISRLPGIGPQSTFCQSPGGAVVRCGRQPVSSLSGSVAGETPSSRASALGRRNLDVVFIGQFNSPYQTSRQPVFTTGSVAGLRLFAKGPLRFFKLHGFRCSISLSRSAGINSRLSLRSGCFKLRIVIVLRRRFVFHIDYPDNMQLHLHLGMTRSSTLRESMRKLSFQRTAPYGHAQNGSAAARADFPFGS
jgi:hypothetical protein